MSVATEDELRSVCDTVKKLQDKDKHTEAISMCDSFLSSLPADFSEQRHALVLLHRKAWSLYKTAKLEEAWLLWQQVYQKQHSKLGIEDTDTRSTVLAMCLTVCSFDTTKPEALKTYLKLWKKRILIVFPKQLPLNVKKLKIKPILVSGSSQQSQASTSGHVIESEELWAIRETAKRLNLHQKRKEASSLCDAILASLPANLSEHRHVLGITQTKAKCMFHLKDYKEAWLLWQTVYKKQIDKLGLEDCDTRESFNEMCNTAAKLHTNGKTTAWKTYITLWQEKLKHPSVNLENSLNDVIDISESVRLLDKGELVYEMYDLLHATLTSKRWVFHPLTLRALLGKAGFLYDMNKKEESWQIYLKVCELCEEEPRHNLKNLGIMHQIIDELIVTIGQGKLDLEDDESD